MDIETRLSELGLELPQASDPQGSYCNCVRTGNLLYVSGKGPVTLNNILKCWTDALI
ncbi:TPA: hypothetical protein ACVOZE_003050 [Vibrio diabolicus]